MKNIAKSLKSDNAGSNVITSILAIFGFFLIFSTLLMIFSTEISAAKITKKAEYQLNQLTVQVSEDVYDAITEKNYNPYVSILNINKSTYETQYISELKKQLNFHTNEYDINEDTIDLEFEVRDDIIIYRFSCDVKFKFHLFGYPMTIKAQDIEIETTHNFKEEFGNDIEIHFYEDVNSFEQKNLK